MAHLPFTVVHGRMISGVLVATGGVLGVLAVRLLRGRSERAFVAYQRKKRVGAAGALVAGRATIRGQLRGRAAMAVSHDGTAIRERSDELVLDVNGTLVEIRGDVDVAGGTRAKASWRQGPPGLVAKQARDAWRAYEVRDGDDVIATGELANVAGGTDGTYR